MSELKGKIDFTLFISAWTGMEKFQMFVSKEK